MDPTSPILSSPYLQRSNLSANDIASLETEPDQSRIPPRIQPIVLSHFPRRQPLSQETSGPVLSCLNELNRRLAGDSTRLTVSRAEVHPERAPYQTDIWQKSTMWSALPDWRMAKVIYVKCPTITRMKYDRSQPCEAPYQTDIQKNSTIWSAQIGLGQISTIWSALPYWRMTEVNHAAF